ncbi:MAG: O-antigen ligase family protein [Solirubrobacteraceae bacterium]
MNPPPTDTFRESEPNAAQIDNGASAPVIPFPPRPDSTGAAPIGTALGAVAVLVALAMAASPLAIGYFNFSVWGPLTLVAMVLLIVVAWSSRPVLSARALLACGGLGLLLALSAASMLWAESKEAAWTDTNRLALYATVFLIALLAVRDNRTARLVVLILGLAALVSSLILPLDFILGGGQSAFLTKRLNDPIGYINGTAGLLVMGVWPWVACAQTASSRRLRAASLAGATLIAGTFVLTESRAVIPATVLTAAIVIACAPGRTRRAVNLLVLAGCVALSLHWTLRVYSQGGPAARNLLPAQGLIRDAGLAILFVAALAGGISLLVDALLSRLEPERRSQLSRRLGRAMLGTTVIALLVAVLAGHNWISREWNTFTALKVNEAATVRFTDASGFRYDLWRVAVKEFREHPLGGVGAGNYDTEYYRLRRNPEYVVQPHSLELQTAAELGIGGLLALLVFCGVVLSSGFLRKGTLASTDPLLRIAALGIFSAWLIDTSVDWLYDIPGLTGMAMIAAALLVLPAPGGRPTAADGPPVPAERPRRSRSRGGQATLIGGLGVLALLAASVGRQYVASRYASSGTSEIARSPSAALGDLRTGSKLDPYSLQALYSIASAYARLDDYPRAHAALLLAQQREPSNYVPPALLGDLAVRRGYLRAALAYYQRALQLNPGDPGVAQAIQQTQAALSP